MKRAVLNLAILSSMSGVTIAQTIPNSSSDIKVNADVDAGCFLTADNINFGILMMPIN